MNRHRADVPCLVSFASRVDALEQFVAVNAKLPVTETAPPSVSRGRRLGCAIIDSVLKCGEISVLFSTQGNPNAMRSGSGADLSPPCSKYMMDNTFRFVGGRHRVA